MPIDYRIPYEIGSQRSKIIDPATLASLREKVAARQQDQLLANQKYEADQQELQRTNMLRQLLPRVVSPEGQVDQNALGQYIQAGGDPREAADYRRAIVGPQDTARWTAPKTVPNVVRDGVAGQLVLTPEGETFEPYPNKPAPVVKPAPQQRAPTGYRFTEQGGLEPIPGGPAAGGGIGGKPPTESQQKFSLYAQTLGDALPPLNQLYATGYNPSAIAMKLSSMDPTALVSSIAMDGLSAADAEWISLINNVADSIVRPRSGAAITIGDVTNTILGYVPLPQEGAATRQRKMANLEKQRTYLQNIAEGRTAGSAKPAGTQPAAGKKAPPVNLDKLIPR